MKLLIEIPEEQYRTLNAKSQNDVVAVVDDALLIKAIRNGKPLDVVLDEIRAVIETDTEKWWCEVNDCFIKQSDVLNIIDKYKESRG